MSYTASTTAASVSYYTNGLIGIEDFVPMLVVFVVIFIVISLLSSIFGLNRTEEDDEEEDFVEELPERNEYQATLECQNCKHEQKIPIVKGYDIEEAIKIGDYFCKICGSKKLKRKKAYWD